MSAHSNLPEFSPRDSQSIQADQAAIEQARHELGPNADPRLILSRASQIKHDREPNSLVWRIAKVASRG